MLSTEPVHCSTSLPGGAGGSNPGPCEYQAGALLLYRDPVTVVLKDEIYLDLVRRVQLVEARGWKGLEPESV